MLAAVDFNSHGIEGISLQTAANEELPIREVSTRTLMITLAIVHLHARALAMDQQVPAPRMHTAARFKETRPRRMNNWKRRVMAVRCNIHTRSRVGENGNKHAIL